MDDFLAAVGVLHGQIEGRTGASAQTANIHAPAFRRVGKRGLQFDELGEVVVVQRVGLAEVSAGVELIVPGLAGRRSFLKEQDHGFHSGSLKRAAGAVQNRVQVAAFQQQFAETHRGVVGVGQERVLDDHARSPACFQDLDESLQEQKRGFSRANREVLLNLFAFLPAERWIDHDHIDSVFVLNVGEVLGERVRVDDDLHL